MTARVALVAQNPGLPFVFDAAGRVDAALTLLALPGVVVPPDLPNVEAVEVHDIFGDREGALDHLAKRHADEAFDAVVTTYEPAAPFTAEAARLLGLRGVDPEAARICRDKLRQREAMAEAGLDVPGFRHLDPQGDVATQVEGLRFPVVVKPVNGLASQGVSRADGIEELRRAIGLVEAINEERLRSYLDTAHGEREGVLVEEFVDGPEYCVESVSGAGGTKVLAITDKGNLRGPYFEERTFVTPAPIDAATAARIEAAVLTAHRQIGIDFGASHTELRLRADGSPVLLEIAARMGGSGTVHFLVEEATGIDFLGAVLRQAIDGELPELAPTRRRTAGDWIVPVEGHGVYRGLAGLDEVWRRPETVYVLELMRAGVDVPAWPRFVGYPAFVLSSHASFEECIGFHEWLGRTMKIEWDSPTG